MALRREIGGVSDLFFIRWVLEHHPRQEGVLQPNLSDAQRELMLSSASPMALARQALAGALNKEDTCTKVRRGACHM